MTDVTLIKFEMVVDGQRQEAGFVSQDKLDGLLRDPGTLGSFLRRLRDAETAEDVLLQCDPTGHRYFYFWCPNCETRVVVETAERGIDDSRDVDALPETDIPCPMCSHMMWTWDEVVLRDWSFANRGTWADFKRWRAKQPESVKAHVLQVSEEHLWEVADIIQAGLGRAASETLVETLEQWCREAEEHVRRKGH